MTDAPTQATADAPLAAAAPRGRSTQFLELTPEGLRRRFVLVVPLAHVLMLRDRRVEEMRLAPEPEDPAEAADPRLVALRKRLADAALADACERAAADAAGALLRRLGLETAGAPRIDTLAAPPGGDLILRVTAQTLPDPEPPDPAKLRIERLRARPDPAEVDRALAALAAARTIWVEPPPGTRAEPGDILVCDIAATLPPPPNRLPSAGLDGAAAGVPGALPEGWGFGDNGSGLAMEVRAVEPGAAPPYLTLRIHGVAPSDGQSYVIFHPPGAIAAAAGSVWAGSVALRQAATPLGLRGGKLRLDARTPDGRRSLRRKDAALIIGNGFARLYVSDTLADPETGLVRLALLFDHAAGPVDFAFDLAAPRLLEGFDLGQQEALPLPEFTGRVQRIEVGAASDPAGLGPHLVGLAAGERRVVAARLPQTLEDRALAGREAEFAVLAATLLRRKVPEVDAELAAALGFEGLPALREWAERRVAERLATLERRQVRRAVLDALLGAAPPMPLPEEALRAELAAIWPRLVAAAQAKGEAPRQEQGLARAARRLRARLLVRAVAKRHGIVPTEADLREAAAREPSPPPSPEELRALALEARVIAFLLERALVTEREADPAELAARVEG